MKNKIIHFFHKSSSNWRFWFLTAFIFKLLFFIFKVITRTHVIEEIDGFWGMTDMDTVGYLSPIENFIKTGSYYPDYRMPGYGMLYLPFILLFSKGIACNLLIISQLILSALSVYSLALITKFIFKNERYFYLTFFLYSLSCFTCSYDTWLMTESLTTSLLIYSTYYLIKYYETGKNYQVFLSGLFLTWSVFCRPVMVPLLLFFLIFIVLKNPKTVRIYFIFLLPFFICDSLWIYHNYQKYKSISPLYNEAFYAETINGKYNSFNLISNKNESYSTNTLEFSLIKFGQAWGGPFIYEPNNMFGLLPNNKAGISKIFINYNTIPDYIYTSKFNKDSLVSLVGILDSIQDSKVLTKSSKEKYKLLFNEKIHGYVTSLKNEKPFVYYIKAPCILLKRFLLNSGSPILLDKPATPHDTALFTLKILFAVLYYIVLTFGLIGILILRKKFLKFESLEFLIIGIALYIVIIHPIVLRDCLTRYLVPAYPFIVVCAVVGILSIDDKFLIKKNHTNL